MISLAFLRLGFWRCRGRNPPSAAPRPCREGAPGGSNAVEHRFGTQQHVVASSRQPNLAVVTSEIHTYMFRIWDLGQVVCLRTKSSTNTH
ncbi:uncharacterized protein F5891DRAFT_138719 [Suillus fuscotomentosus]|uniref:Uncharacterized protein n=1 Tax=Suillus fuscotomentosus TaxID=1912939 RepID=A0AAD4DQC7_9AGAM|nr:uncharacterized protein F5891DRAFT_138719 [Suillus fuscotomentosus]KAG1889662.1 hypothetical protein F5891DRAFT_138719 [Suillus fuscotomentosus]